jgi:hypothetical protein
MPEEFTTAGDFAVNAEARTVRGLLVPFGEASRLSVSGIPPLAFKAPADLRIPRDVTILNANDNHDRYKPIARFVSASATPQGVVADFAIGNTPEGDNFLAEYAKGTRMKLSPELRDIRRYADGLFGTAELTGAGFVPEGAWTSTGLFAVADDAPAPVVEPDPVPLATKTVLTPDAATGVLAVEADAVPITVDVTVGTAVTSFINPTSGEPTMPEDAVIPTGAFAARNKARRGIVIDGPNGDFAAVRPISEALAAFYGRGDRSALDAIAATERPTGEQGMFALSDVKLTTAGSVGINILQPQWIGQLWAGRRYARRYIPLLGHADLKSFKVSGWDWTTKPAMATWAGDKAAITSNAPATEAKTFNALRFAGAHDIAREYRDFDVPEFWDSYFAAMTDSYAALSDTDALTTLVAGSTAVTAATVPPTGVPQGLVSIVDGAMAVLPLGIPTFAIVSPELYRDLLLTRSQDTMAFLNLGLGLEEGTIESFKIVPGAVGTGKVLVGINAAATTYELPGSPIRTEALDQIKGGIDEALFGYEVTIIENPQALALVTPHA